MRKFNCHPAHEYCIAVFCLGSLTTGQATNISESGLQLEYQAIEADPAKWKTVYIFTQGSPRLYILGIPCKLNYDIVHGRDAHVTPGRLLIRLAGLEFSLVSMHQETRLITLLKQCRRGGCFSRPS